MRWLLRALASMNVSARPATIQRALAPGDIAVPRPRLLSATADESAALLDLCCRSGCADCVLIRGIDPVTGLLRPSGATTSQLSDTAEAETVCAACSSFNDAHGMQAADVSIDAFLAFERRQKHE